MRATSLAIILMALSATANAWQSTIETTYQVGETESRMAAKEHALQALKVKAVGQARSYVEQTKTLQNGELRSSITVVGASLVELSDVETTLKLESGDNLVMSAKAQAHLDESVLASRIKQLHEDQSKKKAIARLSEKNRQLRERLDELRNASSDQLSETLENQAETYRAINELNNSAEQVFERGTLLDMADESEKQFDRAWSEIEKRFFGRIADTPVKTKLLRVRKDSGDYLAEIEVTFRPDFEAITADLSHLVNFGVGEGGISVQAPLNRDLGPRHFSEHLVNRMMDTEIWMTISVGGVSKSLRVAGESSGMYLVHKFVPGEDDELMIRGGEGEKASNPVVLELTREQAETAQRVSAEIHIER